MALRHARTNRPPSTAGTFAERATRRPGRAAFAVAGLVVVSGSVVAAQPLAAPSPSATESIEDASVELVSAAIPGAGRAYAPGEGPVRTIGYATALATGLSAESADSTATYMSGSVLAARDAFFAEVARQAAEREAAEREAAAEAARRAEAEAAAAEAAAAAPAPAPAVAGGSTWDALAQCESGGNWHINTGNGYYGGLQFSLSSWRGVGGTGYPHEASRETQIAMGERLKAQGGWGHWPACSRKLGLR